MSGGEQDPICQRTFLELQVSVTPSHTAFQQDIVAPRDEMNRQRIEHFISQDYSSESIRQAIEPPSFFPQMVWKLPEAILLAGAQVAANVQHPVPFRQLLQFVQCGQEVRGQATRARPELQHAAAGPT
jgi:hypothetical protein